MSLRHFHVTNRGEYGDFFLRAGQQRRENGEITYWCQLTCNTSFGCVGHYWGAMGTPAAQFLSKIDSGYALGKLFGPATEKFDAFHAVEDAKRFVGQDLEGNEIDKATAAERIEALTEAGISNEFEWHIFVSDNNWLFDWLINGASAGRIPNPQAQGFWELLWPGFLEALATPVAIPDAHARQAEVAP